MRRKKEVRGKMKNRLMTSFSRGKIITLLFFIASLPFLILAVQNAQRYLSQAEEVPANIKVETKTSLGPLPQVWRALAQGGEERGQRLSNLTSAISPLAPRYLRIDHLYDFYDVVSKDSNGKLFFDFSRLDQVVNDILSIGAKPFLSLSYMPPAISQGDITDLPLNWLDWQEVVQKTIEHYSGKTEQNITDVIYEVWNEPDLFGQWKMAGEKDYRLLYLYASRGAAQASNINAFKIGGPATTSFYKNWLEEFIKYVYQRGLRLDFFSWHKYAFSPTAFIEDINFIDSLLTRHGGSYLLPKYITEWGSIPENSTVHDTNFDAAHTVAVLRQIFDRVDLAFAFEMKDGRSPTGERFWGRWGLLTHESTGLVKKPRYFALALLAKMTGERLKTDGEGTFVSGFAAKDGQNIRLILTNFDQQGRHSESVPITFTGLEPGEYLLRQTGLDGKTTVSEETVSADSLTKIIFLPANSVVLLEFSL